jgi:midasin (ATPase involved in ribosome maturation)
MKCVSLYPLIQKYLKKINIYVHSATLKLIKMKTEVPLGTNTYLYHKVALPVRVTFDHVELPRYLHMFN